jgi:hypothetical protein
MKTAFNGGGGGGRSMAAAAFDCGCDGMRIGDVKANMVIDTSGGGWRQRASALMDGGGRWCLTVVIDDCCGSSGQWK